MLDVATNSKPTLLEASDVARILGLSYSGFYVIVKAGKLEPAYVTPRGLRLFIPEAVELFRAQREQAKRNRARAEGDEIEKAS
jgi:hypothetical protein